MKKYFIMGFVGAAVFMSQPSAAENLEYMLNPPKERTAEEVQADIVKMEQNIAREQKVLAKLRKEQDDKDEANKISHNISNEKSELAELREERDGDMADLAPAAGPGAQAPVYDNLLGH